MALPNHIIENLKNTINTACADRTRDIPGTSIVVISKDGKELFAHAAGKRGVTSNQDMTLDSVFWIASCTKMIAGIAVMQLVEQGKLSLDDGEEMERLVPELKDIKVLGEDGTLVEKKRKVTLRMLLTHTGMFSFLLRVEIPRILVDGDVAKRVSDTRSSTTNCVTTRIPSASTSSQAISATYCNH
jgi:CubicO group peptidase (beta-lactamase class C family)